MAKYQKGSYPVRLQVAISVSMDDRLDDLSEIMGVTKNEIVRNAVAQLLLGYSKSIEVLKDRCNAEMDKEQA